MKFKIFKKKIKKKSKGRWIRRSSWTVEIVCACLLNFILLWSLLSTPIIRIIISWDHGKSFLLRVGPCLNYLSNPSTAQTAITIYLFINHMHVGNLGDNFLLLCDLATTLSKWDTFLLPTPLLLFTNHLASEKSDHSKVKSTRFAPDSIWHWKRYGLNVNFLFFIFFGSFWCFDPVVGCSYICF
jgi:hypothetical protein